ncbi:MAG: alanine:cation symporter family protein [Tepidanaerobacter acetatoxydans]|uniref:Amino-acid carrier protein AlsT n=1 Tax=Tepidanaerobacter acetatoxydans (strain DSM 21804 / JCM 16047 / Re1) TaxID=1209989 RepID=F4LUE9_TEPAE|nr:alanine/glycine:cation symporter family protein [Tepidanaerobacter acetatoxydans]AEE92594.1 amino acid carrier protein [Tepidanaerobacter acetatoxydans Re1]NLU09935.1 alanine:cation symporter family protein [Tepidanaerobacter acetatoxydans]CCP27555.1 Amino-acid carrier protein AlsT [Tepidanaerobacter acetatoxydans Re1]
MLFLETLVSNLNNWLYSYVLIVMLIGLGIYFTIKIRFGQFRLIGNMIQLTTEATEIIEGKKGISAFQAFCISAASRIGTGNIAGVAIAISAGGPGAVFWMWVIALIGGATSFVESTLGQIYKVRDKDTYRGGPAYYIEQALGKRGLGIFFSILTAITFGLIFNSVQANTIAGAFDKAFNIKPLYMGIALFVVVGYIIFGGVRRIANVSSVIVPVMATLYIGVALYIMIINYRLVPKMFALIFTSAFGLRQVAGGTLGAAIMNGVRRGLFSNEAGMGSVPNAAATAATSHPAKQGLIQTLGVYVDTLLVCSATAFIILLSGLLETGTDLQGVQLTQAAISSQVGDWGNTFIAICVLLFAFSSIIGNYYYGETNIEFIESNPVYLNIYRILVLLMVFFGSIGNFGLVWDSADIFMGIMAIVNLVVITKLGPIAYATFEDYVSQLKEGKNPVFDPSKIPGLGKVECWRKK